MGKGAVEFCLSAHHTSKLGPRLVAQTGWAALHISTTLFKAIQTHVTFLPFVFAAFHPLRPWLGKQGRGIALFSWFLA